MRRLLIVLGLIGCVGCAGLNKTCSQAAAGAFGSDWIVVQYDFAGKPFHCWKLRGASVGSSEGGNVNWQDPANGHLVHLTGWENRVQVTRGDFDTAAKLIGVDANLCDNGVYPTK